MAHYAKVSAGKVTKVIVADQDFIESIKIDDEPGEWVQTSYNTYGGVHYDRSTNPPTPSKDQSTALRKNMLVLIFIITNTLMLFMMNNPIQVGH